VTNSPGNILVHFYSPFLAGKIIYAEAVPQEEEQNAQDKAGADATLDEANTGAPPLTLGTQPTAISAGWNHKEFGRRVSSGEFGRRGSAVEFGRRGSASALLSGQDQEDMIAKIREARKSDVDIDAEEKSRYDPT
jgi:hypothetical protein